MSVLTQTGPPNPITVWLSHTLRSYNATAGSKTTHRTNFFVVENGWTSLHLRFLIIFGVAAISGCRLDSQSVAGMSLSGSAVGRASDTDDSNDWLLMTLMLWTRFSLSLLLRHRVKLALSDVISPTAITFQLHCTLPLYLSASCL